MSHNIATAAWRDPRSFTLVELIEAIAIVALLIAILVPSLQAAKTFALRVKC